jgi:hypothetical protein
MPRARSRSSASVSLAGRVCLCPTDNGYCGAEQAYCQARYGGPSRPGGGQGVEDYHDCQVGHARRQGEGDLRGPQGRRSRERRYRIAPARYHRDGEHQSDYDDGTTLAPAGRGQRQGQRPVQQRRMTTQPRELDWRVPRICTVRRNGRPPPGWPGHRVDRWLAERNGPRAHYEDELRDEPASPARTRLHIDLIDRGSHSDAPAYPPVQAGA